MPTSLRWLQQQRRLCLACVLLVVCTVPVAPAHALLYAITNKARPCFVEEVGVDTDFITGTYLWHAHHHNANTKLELVLKAPSAAVVHTLTLAPGVSSNTHTETEEAPFDSETTRMLSRGFSLELPRMETRELGPYQLCLVVTPPLAGIDPVAPIRLSIDVDQAATADLLAQRAAARELELARKATVGEAGAPGTIYKTYFHQLYRDMIQIEKEVDAMEHAVTRETARTVRMRATAESTFTRVWVMSLLTAVVMLAAIWWQFHWLSTTIVKHKLI